MTTAAPHSPGRSAASRAPGLRTRGLPALMATEARLFLRDRGNVFFVVAFPAVLYVGMVLAVPVMDNTVQDLPGRFAGLRVLDLFAPVVVTVAVATAGLTALPTYLAGYREAGVLRRLSTTPMRPHGVLLAQVVVQLGGLAVGTALAVGIGTLALGAPLPVNPVLGLVTFVLATAAMFGIGLVLGGLAPKASTASGLGMLLYFPMLFLAGLWTPGPAMPDTVAQVATYSPLGAASQAMTSAWFGGDLPLVQLVLWALGLFAVAARTFRWS